MVYHGAGWKERRELAEQLIRFRVENMFTQRMLAKMLGISRRTVQMIEAGMVTPHFSTLYRFADFRRRYERLLRKRGER